MNEAAPRPAWCAERARSGVSLDIAVVGGGIGGLAAAAFLHRAGLTATVYEQAGEIREIGAGLVVAPNAVRLLRRLGRDRESRAAYGRAIELAGNTAETAYLTRRRDQLG